MTASKIPRGDRAPEVQPRLLGDAGDVLPELPDTAFERYLAEVERTHPERPWYQPGPIWTPIQPIGKSLEQIV